MASTDPPDQSLSLVNHRLRDLFTQNIPSLWRLLLDQLVRNEIGDNEAAFYPFFFIQQSEKEARIERTIKAYDWPHEIVVNMKREASGPYGETRRSFYAFSLYMTAENENDQTHPSVSILYLNGLVSQYLNFAACYDFATAYVESENGLFVERSREYGGYVTSPRRQIFRVDHQHGRFRADWLGDSLRVLWNQGGLPHGQILSLVLTEMEARVRSMLERMRVIHEKEGGAHLFPPIARESGESLLARVRQFVAMDVDELVQLFPLVVLTIEAARPYRQILFEFVCATPEEQHALLIHVLREVTRVYRHVKNEDVVGKYGSDSVRCSACGLATGHASLHNLLPCCENSQLCQQLSVATRFVH